ncbi:MAG: HD domain-containing protein [Desulfobacterales bacterium]|uniref:HD domain-containing protein n=1 Tax=Candidatus Desulfatibia profunda TaxID=2841695 RepID=A0A8J6TNS3_9BACT|nr:HD domain-containing protein [Candidatus Desulfatibia profunda]MBL7179025.1 HD domain-containing protein [Desulfobacterales bacterium]
MNKTDLKYLKKWFADYTSAFYTDDHDYNLALNIKERHTMRVCENVVMIGESLGISKHDLVIAETAALFHDLGRFKQFKEYGTFNDMNSENHARLGLREMAAHKVLSKCLKAEKALIIKTVNYHNCLKLPSDEDERTLHFIRLIRDADKLDIWKFFLEFFHQRNNWQNNAMVLELPDKPEYSKKFIEALHSQTIASMKDMKTLNDFKLLQIGWVYDLNFFPSVQVVQSDNIIERIEALLPQSKEIAEAVRQAKDYVKMRLEKSN